MKKEIDNPHDKFFRYALSQRKVMLELLEQYLPSKILQCMDLENIEPVKGCFVDEHLSYRATDVLLKTRFNAKPGYLYFLIEHQRKPERFLPLRLLRYMIRVMQHHLDCHKNVQSLPCVYPLVIFNGTKPYPYSMNLYDIAGAQKDLFRSILENFQLVDLRKTSDEIILEQLWSGMLQFVMKHIDDQKLLARLNNIESLFYKIELDQGGNYVVAVLNYLISASKMDDTQGFVELVKKSTSPEVREKVMSLAKVWQEECLQKGLQEGEKKGIIKGKKVGQLEGLYKAKLQIAQKMLLQEWSVEQIATITGLSFEQINQLKVEVII